MDTSTTASRSVSSRSSERCYQILRKMLICLQIPPGTRLGEVEWSEKLGIQRAALREAMVLLVHDGLLRRRSSGGFFTPRLDEIDVDGIVDVRAVLEIGAIRLTCARKLPADDFRSVEEVCDMMQRCHDTGLTSGFAEADFLFHQRLLEMSGNAALIQMFSHSAQLIFVVAPLTDEVRGAAEVATIQEHRKILALVRGGKVEQAAALVGEHLAVTKRTLKAILNS